MPVNTSGMWTQRAREKKDLNESSGSKKSSMPSWRITPDADQKPRPAHPASKEGAEKTIFYFDNHQHMMPYNVYLQNGYLISTGVVGETCGSLVEEIG